MQYLIPFLTVLSIIGIIGMGIGNRQKPPDVRKQRWGKTISYILVIYSLVGFIIYGHQQLPFLGLFITVVGLFELINQIIISHRKSNALWLYQTISILLYLIISVGFLRFLSLTTEGVIFVALIVFVFDAFSQIVGQIAGKHKLSPIISPNKTIEGSLGGLFFALLVGYFLYSTLHLGSNSWFFDTFIVSISSLTGDLAASHFKRRHGVKDYSQLIPYQGGFLDRFDSLLLAGAVFYAINGPLSIALDSTKYLSLLLSLASSCANH